MAEQNGRADDVLQRSLVPVQPNEPHGFHEQSLSRFLETRGGQQDLGPLHHVTCNEQGDGTPVRT